MINFQTLITPYDIRDKTAAVRYWGNYLLCRTLQMVHYEGLPESIPERDFKILLQTRGNAVILNKDYTGGNYFAFWGNLTGDVNAYYMPTSVVIANPAIDLSGNYELDVVSSKKNYHIGDEAFLIPHDSTFTGLMPLIRKYATLLAENDISMYMSSINSRLQHFITAMDDSDKAGAEKFINDLVDGKFSAVASKSFLGKVSLEPSPDYSRTILALIELEQYWKASFFHEIGIDANFNMKREALNSAEVSLNEDALKPFIDDIIETQSDALDRLNSFTGLNVHVSLGSIWKEKNIDD